MRSLASVTVNAITIGGFMAALPSFPGVFVQQPPVAADIADGKCLALGDDMFDKDVTELGNCRALGLHDVGPGAGLAWVYGTYSRTWRLTAADTVGESEVVLFSKPTSGDASRLQPVWHYRFESGLLASATPEVVSLSRSAALLSVDECANGTGGCSQSFAILRLGSPKEVKSAFLDSLNRRFPGGIRHGFHVDIRTLRGSLALYSGNDPNCCPSTIGEFSLRLRGNSLELATLKLRRAD